MKLSSGEDDVLARLLDERLHTRVGLIQKTETLDKLGQVGRILRLESDSDDRRRLQEGRGIEGQRHLELRTSLIKKRHSRP